MSQLLNMKISIRPYLNQDFNMVTAVWLKSWQSTGIPSPVTLDELRERWPNELANGWEVHVAMNGGEAVGFIAFHDAELEQLFIDPTYQSLGIGLQLLNFAKAKMPEGFHLTTALESRALQFYEREGLMRGETVVHPRFGHQIVQYNWKPENAIGAF
jgi:putative acetyltransferase